MMGVKYISPIICGWPTGRNEMTNIRALPVEKIGATAAEKLYELANRATEHPEQFTRMVIGHVELCEDGSEALNWHQTGMSRASEICGMLEVVKLDIVACMWNKDHYYMKKDPPPKDAG